MTLEDIAARIDAAWRTLEAADDPEWAWLCGLKAYWPGTMPDWTERWAAALVPEVVEVGVAPEEDVEAARGFGETVVTRARASPAEVDAMIPTLLWLRYLSPRQRRLVIMRAKGWEWWKIAGRLKREAEAVEGWYWQAIGRIAQQVDGGEQMAHTAGRRGI